MPQVYTEQERRKLPLSDMQNLWNLKCGNISMEIENSADHRKKESLRLGERSLDDWGRVFEMVARSDFCQGRGHGAWDWKADYNWIIANEDNGIKVLEGKYDNPVKQGNGVVV